MKVDIAAELAAGRVISPAEFATYAVLSTDDLGNGVYLYRGIDNHGRPFASVQAPAAVVLGARGLA